MHLEKIENLPVKLPSDIQFSGNGNPLETSDAFKNVILPNGKKEEEKRIQWIRSLIHHGIT